VTPPLTYVYLYILCLLPASDSLCLSASAATFHRRRRLPSPSQSPLLQLQPPPPPPPRECRSVSAEALARGNLSTRLSLPSMPLSAPKTQQRAARFDSAKDSARSRAYHCAMPLDSPPASPNRSVLLSCPNAHQARRSIQTLPQAASLQVPNVDIKARHAPSKSRLWHRCSR
jgi:hypothetical protein